MTRADQASSQRHTILSSIWESIYRPYSVAMTDQPTHGNRSYHPYAVSSHSGSAQSSPGTYNVRLDYNTPMTSSSPSHLSRSSSAFRPGSSHLPDQMNQMLHLNLMDTGYTGESAGTGGSYGVCIEAILQQASRAEPIRTMGARPMVTQSGNPDVHSDNIGTDFVYELRNEMYPGDHAQGSVSIPVSQRLVIH